MGESDAQRQGGKQTMAEPRAPYRPLASTRYLIGMVVVGVALAVSGFWVPSWLLGLVAGAVVILLGWLAWRRHRLFRMATDPRWRDVMPCYLSVQDRDLRIVETNNLFRRDFGDSLGEHCYRAYKDRDSPCPNCPVLKTFGDGKNHSSEETVVTQDGKVADVVVTSSPLRNRRGDTVAVVEMSTNITEVKELQNELDRSREHFQHLFDVVPCYISVQNRGYEIVETNELFRKDFGDCGGEHCYRVYKGRDSVCPGCPVEKTFRDGQVHSSEESVVTQHGHEVDLMVYSMPIHDEKGEISGVMEVSTNITEVKLLQRELTMVGIAVAGMTHRIKNILTGLEGGIFVVNTGFEMEDDSMVNDGWDMVKRNVTKVSRIAKDLLYCAKEREPNLKDGVRPAAVLHDVQELYGARAAAEGIELAIDVADAAHTARFDEEALHSLVLNLTANAVDACRFDPASHKQHRIVLACQAEADGTTVIEVSDNGAGIADDVSHKVFRSFFSAKGTEGTGIGLLVVQKVVEAHGGTVSFSTKEGEGTTFRVSFPPLADVAQQEEATERTAPSSDEEANAQAAASAAETADTAPDSDAAADVAVSCQPDAAAAKRNKMA